MHNLPSERPGWGRGMLCMPHVQGMPRPAPARPGGRLCTVAGGSWRGGGAPWHASARAHARPRATCPSLRHIRPGGATFHLSTARPQPLATPNPLGTRRATIARASVAHQPDGIRPDLQGVTQTTDLQPVVHPAPASARPLIPSADRRFGAPGGQWGRVWEMKWYLGCIVGESGIQWATRMIMNRGTRVAGLLPPSHPGSDFAKDA